MARCSKAGVVRRSTGPFSLRMESIDFGGIAFEGIPEAAHGPPCNIRVHEACSIVVEDGKLLLGHDVGIGVGLDALPDISECSFQDSADRWMNVSGVAVANVVEGPGNVGLDGESGNHGAEYGRATE